jgi:hypothetical protein
MCIIAYKPQNVAMPSKKLLQICFNNNPDGAGYMIASGGNVIYRKGFMDFGGFYSSLTSAIKRYGEDVPYVLHFRISTQAGVNKQCCHPFPLSEDMDELKQLKGRCDIGIAHNGIISLTSSYSKAKIDYSDTMKFITDYLSLIIRNKNYYKDKNTLTLIDRLIDGSRLAILDSTGHCELIGHGWEESCGVYYSNSSYMAPKVAKYDYGYYHYGGYTYLDKLYDSDEYQNLYEKWATAEDEAQRNIYDALLTKMESGGAVEYNKEDETEDCSSYDNYYSRNSAAYNPATGEYDFTESNCPYAVYDEDWACEHCSNRHYCYFLGNINEGDEDNKESLNKAGDANRGWSKLSSLFSKK